MQTQLTIIGFKCFLSHSFRPPMCFSSALCKLLDYQWLNSCGNWGIRTINWHTQTVHKLNALDTFSNPGLLAVIDCLHVSFSVPFSVPTNSGGALAPQAPPISTPLIVLPKDYLSHQYTYLSSFRSTIVRWYDETSTVFSTNYIKALNFQLGCCPVVV